MKNLHIQLPDEEWAALQNCCEHFGDISFVVRNAIREYVKKKGSEDGTKKLESTKSKRLARK